MSATAFLIGLASVVVTGLTALTALFLAAMHDDTPATAVSNPQRQRTDGATAGGAAKREALSWHAGGAGHDRRDDAHAGDPASEEHRGGPVALEEAVGALHGIAGGDR